MLTACMSPSSHLVANAIPHILHSLLSTITWIKESSLLLSVLSAVLILSIITYRVFFLPYWTWLGLKGATLIWSASYLKYPDTRYINLRNFPKHSRPQDSILGLLLLTLYYTAWWNAVRWPFANHLLTTLSFWFLLTVPLLLLLCKLL